jgi:hypothetical protein
VSMTIKLSEDLINEAKRYAAVYSRSIPKQIEYWSRIGKIAEENPDLPYSFIQEILLAQQEEAEPFNFSQDQTITLTLLALGTHENFYRDLKKSPL